MLTLPAKIFLCRKPVNMRMSFEGLGTLVEQLFPGELLTGALFLFFNKPKSCLKALFWDRDGFCIWYKRLEQGAFTIGMQNHTLDSREFIMLLAGITPQKMRPKFSPKKGLFSL